jgi:hypothetical protein
VELLHSGDLQHQPGTMSKLTPEEHEAIVRRMEEITSQIHNLDVMGDDVPLEERARLSHKLTGEWLTNYRRLRDDK